VSGETDFFIYAVTAISVLAALTDLVRGRIYNWLTAPALIAGIAASTWALGWNGLGQALLGALTGFLLYGWMFSLRVMGGGDVKLLMALGAWGGVRYAVEVGLLGILLGGLMAVGILLAKGKLGDFTGRMKRFLLTVFVKELELEAPRVDRKMIMPFGVPIAVAAIWTAFGKPLQSLGLPL
jgi:prepilin peptidase CpaA